MTPDQLLSRAVIPGTPECDEATSFMRERTWPSLGTDSFNMEQVVERADDLRDDEAEAYEFLVGSFTLLYGPACTVYHTDAFTHRYVGAERN